MPHRTGTTAQRIRVGMTGLAIAFLVVLLASIVSRSANDDNDVAANIAVSNTAEPSEPLAELGVAPGSKTSENASNDSK
jgi:hypothetical protein